MPTFYKLLAIGLVIGFLAYYLPPIVHRPLKNPERIEALNNIRQMHHALIEFDKRYGSFPNEETLRQLVEQKGISSFDLASSNDFFRQLVASGILESEKPGYCLHKTLPTHRPDGMISPVDEAFSTGECGFAYIGGLSSGDAPDTPLLVAPLVPGTHRFDPKPFGGKAIVLRLDGSATPMTIREDNGLVSIGGGKTFFDADAPHWHGKTPEIKYPAAGPSRK